MTRRYFQTRRPTLNMLPTVHGLRSTSVLFLVFALPQAFQLVKASLTGTPIKRAFRTANRRRRYQAAYRRPTYGAFRQGWRLQAFQPLERLTTGITALRLVINLVFVNRHITQPLHSTLRFTLQIITGNYVYLFLPIQQSDHRTR